MTFISCDICEESPVATGGGQKLDHLLDLLNVGFYTHSQIDAHLNANTPFSTILSPGSNPHNITIDKTVVHLSPQAGDLFVFNGLNVARVPIGANGTVLSSNGTTVSYIPIDSIQSEFFAGNFISLDGNTFELGGSGTKNTILNGENFSIDFQGFSSVVFKDIASISTREFDFNSTQLNIQGSRHDILAMSLNTKSTIGTLDVNINFERNIAGDHLAYIVDQRSSPSGLQYSADYSSTFVDESLVTKRYVDNFSLWKKVTLLPSSIYYNQPDLSTVFVGIGVDNPLYRLHVNGDIYAAGNIFFNSDKNLKSNIKSINDLKSLKFIANTHSFKYDKDGRENIGFIAQDFEKEFPEVLRTGQDGFYAIDQYGILAILWSAVRQLNREVYKIKRSEHGN